MNNKRRDLLRSATRYLSQSLIIVERVCDQETDAMDNCPENLQSSDRFATMEEVVDLLGDAVTNLEGAMEKIESAISS